ncbi:MAG: hypothetical protein K9K66_18090 [Desulfarculaceae bacterium]|nr:hypothetical protein [Desulfarculaceae bacterium]MCF8074516.1 hypothetical protein [Desulfarculaceae bacterium]MCF8103572.1 hypothetical protein [Desulfarculaceae bacterium]MCF8118236.1 hypothetical protein [Desulfarculaceae bacterium]
MISLLWAPPALWAQEGDPSALPEVAGEQELTQGVRSGRLKRDELIAKGRELSYFQKLRLYYYAQELEPYFLGVEEAIRDLARTPPDDGEALARARRALYQAMGRSWDRLRAAKRPGPEVEWRRGLTGLIYLDYDWRDRVAEQGKDEITNPYDLVALLDCLDAHLRGLEPGSIDACPATAPEPSDRKGESKQP